MPFDYGTLISCKDELYYIRYNNSGNIDTRQYRFTKLDKNGEWTDLPTAPFIPSQAITYNDEIHIFSHNGVHYKFNRDTWTQLENAPVTDISSAYCRTIVHNGFLHIFKYNANVSYHYKYDGSDWTSLASLPSTYYNIDYKTGCVSRGTRIYVINTYNSSNATMRYIIYYDSDTNTWTPTSINFRAFNVSNIGNALSDFYLSGFSVADDLSYFIGHTDQSGYTCLMKMGSDNVITVCKKLHDTNSNTISTYHNGGIYFTNSSISMMPLYLLKDGAIYTSDTDPIVYTPIFE